MSRSLRVELARGGAAAAPANQDVLSPEYSSAFTVQLPSALALPAGTVVSLDSVAIDQQGRDPSLLTIPENITQTFTFAPYIISSDHIVHLTDPNTPPNFYDPWWMFEKQPDGSWVRASYSWQCEIAAGSYSAQGLATLITNQSQEISPEILPDQPPTLSGGNFGRVLLNTDNANVRFSRVDGTGAMVVMATLAVAVDPTTLDSQMALIGSSNGMVLRQNVNSGRIELAYLHTPVQDAASKEVAIIEEYSVSTTHYRRIQFDRSGMVMTGCGFTAADWWSPNNLLAILGFAHGDLLPVVDGPEMNPENFPSYTQTARLASLLPSLDDFQLNRLPDMKPKDAIATEGPKAVSASNYPGAVVGFSSPQFLVETDAIPESNYLTGDGRWRRALGYYQRDFQAGGFAFTSAAVEYEYTKNTVLTRITARLLDPLNNYRPAESLGLRTFLTLRFDIPDEEESASRSPSRSTRRRRRRARKKA